MINLLTFADVSNSCIAFVGKSDAWDLSWKKQRKVQFVLIFQIACKTCSTHTHTHVYSIYAHKKSLCSQCKQYENFSLYYAIVANDINRILDFNYCKVHFPKGLKLLSCALIILIYCGKNRNSFQQSSLTKQSRGDYMYIYVFIADGRYYISLRSENCLIFCLA